MNHLPLIAFLLFTGMFFEFCDDIPHPSDHFTPMIKTKSEQSVDDVYADIKDNINAKGLNIVAEINHGQAAQNIGIDLRPTRLIIFGNPKVGTQLMQSDQRIGIDLPLKMLVYETEEGKTITGYYNASFLTHNYDISDKDNVVQNVNQALADVSASGTQGPTDYVGKQQFESLQMLQSELSVDDAYERIKQAALDRSFNIIGEVNHSAAASSVDLELRPTRLIIFGNPQGGSQLMLSNQKIGIDLPLKMLVWEDENGDTWIGYYQGSFFADRYDIDDKDNVINNVNNALAAISAEAIQ